MQLADMEKCCIKNTHLNISKSFRSSMTVVWKRKQPSTAAATPPILIPCCSRFSILVFRTAYIHMHYACVCTYRHARESLEHMFLMNAAIIVLETTHS